MVLLPWLWCTDLDIVLKMFKPPGFILLWFSVDKLCKLLVTISDTLTVTIFRTRKVITFWVNTTLNAHALTLMLSECKQLNTLHMGFVQLKLADEIFWRCSGPVERNNLSSLFDRKERFILTNPSLIHKITFTLELAKNNRKEFGGALVYTRKHPAYQ